jgi:hypothetical protein
MEPHRPLVPGASPAPARTRRSPRTALHEGLRTHSRKAFPA